MDQLPVDIKKSIIKGIFSKGPIISDQPLNKNPEAALKNYLMKGTFLVDTRNLGEQQLKIILDKINLLLKFNNNHNFTQHQDVEPCIFSVGPDLLPRNECIVHINKTNNIALHMVKGLIEVHHIQGCCRKHTFLFSNDDTLFNHLKEFEPLFGNTIIIMIQEPTPTFSQSQNIINKV